MGNEFRRRPVNGDEQMIHTRERHLVHVHRDEKHVIKAATNRRERREGKAELRSSGDG